MENNLYRASAGQLRNELKKWLGNDADTTTAITWLATVGLAGGDKPSLDKDESMKWVVSAISGLLDSAKDLYMDLLGFQVKIEQQGGLDRAIDQDARRVQEERSIELLSRRVELEQAWKVAGFLADKNNGIARAMDAARDDFMAVLGDLDQAVRVAPGPMVHLAEQAEYGDWAPGHLGLSPWWGTIERHWQAMKARAAGLPVEDALQAFAKNWHPDKKMMIELLMDELTDARRSMVGDHIRRCERCISELDVVRTGLENPWWKDLPARLIEGIRAVLNDTFDNVLLKTARPVLSDGFMGASGAAGAVVGASLIGLIGAFVTPSEILRHKSSKPLIDDDVIDVKLKSTNEIPILMGIKLKAADNDIIGIDVLDINGRTIVLGEPKISKTGCVLALGTRILKLEPKDHVKGAIIIKTRSGTPIIVTIQE